MSIQTSTFSMHFLHPDIKVLPDQKESKGQGTFLNLPQQMMT
jgi:hypothetical protein